MFKGICITLFGVALALGLAYTWHDLQPQEKSEFFLFAAASVAGVVTAQCKNVHTAALAGTLLAFGAGLLWYHHQTHKWAMFMGFAAIGNASWGLYNLAEAIKVATSRGGTAPVVSSSDDE